MPHDTRYVRRTKLSSFVVQRTYSQAGHVGMHAIELGKIRPNFRNRKFIINGLVTVLAYGCCNGRWRMIAVGHVSHSIA